MTEHKTEIIQQQHEATAVSQLPHDLAVIKMENESMMALAAARPRDYAEVLESVKGQLAAYRSFAQEAVYNKPVGKDPNTGQMRYARGLSIRAAEALAEAYRYCKVRSDVTPIDADTVRVEACFTDFQSGRVWQDSGIVSKTYKKRNGTIARHSDDRFYNVVVKAEASKRVRECIMRMIPPGLRSELVICVDAQLSEFLDESTQAAIIAQFANRGATVPMLEGLIGKSLDHFTREDRGTLVGVWNALEAGETTVAEAFGTNGDSQKSDAEIEASLRKEPPKPPPPPANETMTRGASPPTTESEAAMALQAPPDAPPKAEVPAQAATAPPAEPEKPIGKASKTWGIIRRAYEALPEEAQTEIRGELQFGSVDELAVWTKKDAAYALERLAAKKAAQPTEAKP